MAGKVKFVKRGGPIAAVIPESKLVVDGTAAAEIIRLIRTQDLELPREVSVSYIDIDADYQTGVQYSRRLTVQNKDTLNIQLYIAMTADYAKRLANILQYAIWTARNQVPLKLPPEYAYLEPTDLIEFQTDDYSVTLRLGNKSEDFIGQTYESVFDDPSIYTSLATGVALPSKASNVVQTKLPSWLALLDWPLLRDADDDAGFYAIGGGYNSAWQGEFIYRSLDNGQSYAALNDAIIDTATPIGLALSVLGTFTGPNIFDESNSVIVRMLWGSTLSSTTELAVLNGANAIVIGSEVLQYKNATLNGDGDYVLTGLLRGRRGTEWAMSTHVYGERVVVPSVATMLRIPDPSSYIGLQRLYKGISFGTTLASAAPLSFTNTGIGLKCYSPVQIGAGVDASGNATINWIRRTRVGGEWRDYNDVPLGESTESYAVEIWDSSFTVLKRTINTTAPTASYTAAQQTTDFGGGQTALYLKIYQVSATVGRGYPAQAIVTMYVQYATWDPAKKGSNIALSNGNLTASNGSAGNGTVLSTIGVSSGKPFWELTVTNATDTTWLGIATVLANTANTLGSDVYGWGYRGGASSAGLTNNNSTSAYGGHYVTGDKVGVGLDMDNGTLAFWLNGVYQGIAATGLTGTWYAAVSKNGVFNFTANFGPSGFTYPVPAGYTAGLHT
jgi:hypothetical protein